VATEFADGTFLCQPGDPNGCPDSMQCAVDGRCYHDAAGGAAAGGAGQGGSNIGNGASSSTTTSAGGGSCVPKTCEADYAGSCGTLDDGCSGALQCGCVAPLTCINDVCACEGSQTRSPHAATNDGVPASVAWSNPGLVAAADDMSADIGGLTDGAATQRLYAFDFGFSIPDGAAITGYTFRVRRRKGGTGNIEDLAVRLAAGPGNVKGDDRAAIGTPWPDVFAYATYGGASDDWNAGFGASDVNNGSFGASLRAINPANPNNPLTANPLVDHMELTVHFECP
jgi:hypothetical protein